MSSVFTKIINKEIPCHLLEEDENYISFLDISPLARGHALVIPKRETDYIFDMEDENLAGMMVFSKRIAKAIGLTVPCKRVGIAVIGLEVPHAHIHLIPINQISDIDFSRTKMKFSWDEMNETALKIRETLSSI